MMSTLRLFGVLTGVVLAVVYFWLKRRGRIERDSWWIALTMAFILVSLFPSVVSVPAGVLSLSHLKAGRIITLLLLATGVTLVLLLAQRSKTERLSRQLTKTIDHITMSGFDRRYPEGILGDILLIIPAFNEAQNIAVLALAL